jgi:hypothetical protein
MFRFEQRPLKPWGARDAGNFFVKFYIIAQVIAIMCTYLYVRSTLLMVPSMQDSDPAFACVM